MKRTIERIITGPPRHWVGDGFHVSNYFPAATDTQKRMSPFFLLDYHAPEAYAPTEKRRGVGAHPHRGFETVTVAYQGAVAHHDSAGNGGIIRPGEAQWMTAGSGILHNEYHEAAWAKRGGVMHMIQLWVNLPRKHKRTPPKYQALVNGAIAEAPVPGGKGVVRVLAGSYEDVRGAAATFTPARMLDLRLKAGGALRLPAPKDHNAALLVLQGRLRANDASPAAAGEFLLFKNDGDEVRVEAAEDAVALFLSGEPIEEPLVHYGPFVMNSADEINEAVEDYRAGKFGVLND